jgi:hypothetical protein
MLLHHLLSIFFIGFLVPDMCIDSIIINNEHQSINVIRYYQRLHQTGIFNITRLLLLSKLCSNLYYAFIYNMFFDYFLLFIIAITTPYFIFYFGPAFTRIISSTEVNEDTINDINVVKTGHIVLFSLCILQIIVMLF